MADGNIIFLIVLSVVIIYGIADTINYAVIKRKYDKRAQHIEQQITEANIRLGQYTERSWQDPQYEDHMEEVHEEIDKLVYELNRCEEKRDHTRTVAATFNSWLRDKE